MESKRAKLTETESGIGSSRDLESRRVESMVNMSKGTARENKSNTSLYCIEEIAVSCIASDNPK